MAAIYRVQIWNKEGGKLDERDLETPEEFIAMMNEYADCLSGGDVLRVVDLAPSTRKAGFRPLPPAPRPPAGP